MSAALLSAVKADLFGGIKNIQIQKYENKTFTAL